MSGRVDRLALHGFWVSRRWTVRGALVSALALPAIYSLLLPFVLLDVWTQLYEAVCFPLLGIARVRRGDYVVIDRHRLPYLNPLQKINCVYCGYVNGLIAYVREVGARSEQFWCPIRHVRRAHGQHHRHRRFAAYGDAKGFARALPTLRAELAPAAATRRQRRRS